MLVGKEEVVTFREEPGCEPKYESVESDSVRYEFERVLSFVSGLEKEGVPGVPGLNRAQIEDDPFSLLGVGSDHMEEDG